ncbi:MAG TPA: DUF4188 domain-containing protein [Balneolaceae bacterium]|nr:DUF4188 domain-containing protein [Balneolaceae bacterium]
MKRDHHRLKELLHSSENTSVYTASFIFRIKKEDEEFEQFNELIDKAAIENRGYLGKESWKNPEENKKAVIYYWDSLESLKTFSNHPHHKKAKQQYKQWYHGYEVIISEVLTVKSDGGIS